MADNSTRIVITAEDKTQAALASVRNGFSGLTGSLGELSQLAGRIPLIGAALGSSFASLGAIAKHTIDFAAGLHDMSMQTGATVEQLSALRDVAELNGVSLDEAGKSLAKLSKNMIEAASGSKEQAATFDALGVSVKDSKGALRESGDVMVDVAKAIAGLASPTERAAAAQLVFGKAGAALVPMLMDIAAQGQLTATVTAEQAANADRFSDALTRMSQALRGMAERIGLELVEPLAKFAEGIEKAMRSGTQEVRIDWLDRWINTIATKLSEAQKAWADGMQKFWQTVGSSAMAGKFGAQSAEAQAALDKLAQERASLDLRGWDADLANPKNNSGTTFADKLGKASAGAGSKKRSAVFDPEGATLFAIQEAVEKLKRQGFDETEKAMQKQADDLARIKEKYLELGDPLKKYRDMLAEIEGMRGIPDGLTDGEADAAAARVNEQMDEMTKRLTGTKDIARDLGMTFSSAFEDAIVGGKSFSDVLKGLEQDIVRIITRKTITEPLGNAVSDAVSGSGIGKSIGGWFKNLLPSFDVGTNYVPQDMVAMVHKGEAIVPARYNTGGSGAVSVTVNQTISVDARSDKASLLQAMVAAKEQAKNEILASMRRGGVFA